MLFGKGLKLLSAGSLVTATNVAVAEYGLNLPEPVSPVTRDIFDLHMLTAYVATVIMIIITGVVVYALWKFRKSAGYEADQNFHVRSEEHTSELQSLG